MQIKSPMSGIIRYAIMHPVLANLLMISVLILGGFSAMRMHRQALPDFSIQTLVVSATWPAASARDVQTSVAVPIENKLFGLDGMLSMRSTSEQNAASIVMEFKNGTDLDATLQDIRDKIASLQFPEGVDAPRAFQPVTRERTINLLVHGPDDLGQLRSFAYQARRDLLGMGADDVVIQGIPKQELSIALQRDTLHGLGLSIKEIADQVALKAKNIPIGNVGKGAEEQSVRSMYQLEDESDYNALFISGRLGELVRLGNIASVRLQDRHNQPLVFYKNKPAISLNVYRVVGSGNDSFDITRIVNRWMDSIAERMPGATIDVVPYGEAWRLIAQRLHLMLKNGSLGFAFIFLLLLVFLRVRIAFWVAFGVPVAVAGALFFLYAQGGTLNFLSTFGFLMAFGIIVDDTIVVSEQAYSEYQRGMSAEQSAYKAAVMMFTPVLASSLTTVAAFMPLLLMQGLFGQILKDIPLVVIVVILASLLECFVILPHHLKGAMQKSLQSAPSKLRVRFERVVHWAQYTGFRNIVRWAIQHAWITISTSLVFISVPFVWLASGQLKFLFFPNLPSDILFLDADFQPGTPAETVKAFLRKANNDLEGAQQSFSGPGSEVVKTPIQLLSYRSPEGGALAIGNDYLDAHAAMVIGATTPDSRSISNAQFLDEWSARIKKDMPAEVINISVAEPKAGPPGADIRLLVKGNDMAEIKRASEALKSELNRFSALTNVKDSLEYGQSEYVIRLKPNAHALGVSKAALSSQISSGLYGAEVIEYTKFGDNVRVAVQLDKKEQLHADALFNFPIKTPAGNMVPLVDLASASLQPSFVRYQQYNGRMYSEVSADMAAGNNNLQEMIFTIHSSIIPSIKAKFAVDITDEEQSRYETEAVEELQYGAVIGLLMIYLVLAWVSRSYSWPGIVMLVIPFGLSGALAGHYLLNMPITLLSIFGLFGLTGIVINNAIILLHRYHAICEENPQMAKFEAVIEASCQRVRAVFLTTLTTIMGLAPLLFETSLQARFLQPMAVSISFGLATATVLILLVMPTMMALFLGDEEMSIKQENR